MNDELINSELKNSACNLHSSISQNNDSVEKDTFTSDSPNRQNVS